jgi:hypothetical protein
MPSHVKGAIGRDYAAEYAARKARGLARGLTIAQARGHPATGTGIAALRRAGFITTIGGGPDATLQRYYRVVDRLAQGERLSRAARAEHISPATVKRYNAERGLYQPLYRYRDGRPTTVRSYQIEQPGSTPILTADGRSITSPAVDAKAATLLGKYWNAVEKALNEGDDSELRQFRHTVVQTRDGRHYRLLTNTNAIRRFFDSMSDADTADFWRTFYTGRTVVYAPAA